MTGTEKRAIELALGRGSFRGGTIVATCEKLVAAGLLRKNARGAYAATRQGVNELKAARAAERTDG